MSIRASSVLQGYQQQADAVLSQANPVSATLYTVLATTKNVRIISISANITWGVTQPNPLEVLVTVDGRTKIFWKFNPVSAADYIGMIAPHGDESNELLVALVGNQTDSPRAFLMEGRSVKIEVRIIWAVTQPTPLVCRVKWAKIP